MRREKSSTVRWVKFPDGSSYTLAVDIQKFAESNGYKVPCDADGTRHPGSDCNRRLRSIFRDAGIRKTFGLTESCVIDVRFEDGFINQTFFDWLFDCGIVSIHYSGKGVIHLYSKESVNALLSAMLNTHVEYEEDQDDEEWCCPLLVIKRSHNLELKRNKPKVSLFDK